MAVQKKRLKDEKPLVIDPMSAAAAAGAVPPLRADDVDMEQIIGLVNKAVNAIVQRLNAIAHVDNAEPSQMNALMQSAQNPDNLCRMDPAWHPWL